MVCVGGGWVGVAGQTNRLNAHIDLFTEVRILRSEYYCMYIYKHQIIYF